MNYKVEYWNIEDIYEINIRKIRHDNVKLDCYSIVLSESIIASALDDVAIWVM